MGEVRVIAIVRRSLLRHLNGHPDRQFYTGLVGERVAFVPGTERGEKKEASVEVVPCAALDSRPTRLRKIFLEVLPQVHPAAPKAMERTALRAPSGPAPKPNGSGQGSKRKALLYKPKPCTVFAAVRRSGLSRGLR